MRLNFLILAAGFGLVFTLSLRAAELDAILEQHYEALGGLERLREVETLRVEGTNRFQNQELSVTYLARRPNLLRIESSSPDIRVVRVYDGETAWQAMGPPDGRSQVVEMAGQEAVELARESDFDGPLVDYEEKGHSVEYLGRESWGDREVYNLEVTEARGTRETYSLDAENFQVVRKRSQVPVEGGSIEFEIYFDDFREVDGLVFPFATTAVSDGKTVFTGTVEEVDVDPDLPPDLFEKPK